MKFAVAFLLVSAIGLASAWQCPTQNGFYRDPTDSHKFYECVNGNPYLFTCPTGLVFNESIGACDYTTGPEIHRTTEGPHTVPTGSRSRHTEATVVTEPGTTETVVTRGHHGHHDETTTANPNHHEEVTTQHQEEPESTTRGRHGY